MVKCADDLTLGAVVSVIGASQGSDMARERSERSLLESAMAIAGFLFGLVGLVALIWKDTLILLAVAAGVFGALCVALWIYVGRQNIRISRLETDLAEARRQAGEWSTTSSNVAIAIRSMYELAAVGPEAPARKRRAKQEAVPE